MRPTRLSLLAAVTGALAGCVTEPVPDPEPTGPVTHTVVVEPDGSFSPSRLRIHDGDTVEWLLHDRTDTIVAARGDEASAAACQAGAHDLTGGVADFTGPTARAVPGIFALTADDGEAPPDGSLDQVLANPGVAAVFIRLEWNQVHVASGTGASSFDFSVLDREIDRALAHGKRYSVAFKAGKAGTPAWIFDEGVERLRLQDSGSDGDDPSCGFTMELGSPADPDYRRHYFDLLRGVAAHLRERADRYRALAYIKPSGANLLSHENRLPKRCEPGCVCNTRVWAASGYTPSRLYEFYDEQLAVLAAELPDKEMSYALIQDGFPRINDAGDYLTEDGTSSGGALPAGSEQTEQILARGITGWSTRFVVQHNGLRPLPALPNRWVIDAGERGSPTGFQTSNADNVATPAELDSALTSAWTQSDAFFVEAYQGRLAEVADAVLDPAGLGRTLAAWGELFEQRRRDAWPDLGEPVPTIHRHTFARGAAAGDGDEVVTYFHGVRCGGAVDTSGVITIAP